MCVCTFFLGSKCVVIKICLWKPNPTQHAHKLKNAFIICLQHVGLCCLRPENKKEYTIHALKTVSGFCVLQANAYRHTRTLRFVLKLIHTHTHVYTHAYTMVTLGECMCLLTSMCSRRVHRRAGTGMHCMWLCTRFMWNLTLCTPHVCVCWRRTRNRAGETHPTMPLINDTVLYWPSVRKIYGVCVCALSDNVILWPTYFYSTEAGFRVRRWCWGILLL